MSAYMVDREHVVYLVKAAVSIRLADHDGGSIRWWYDNDSKQLRCPEDINNLVKTAQMIWDENMKSINARYPDTIDNMDGAPGPIGENYRIKPQDFQRLRWDDYNPVEVLSAIRCLNYQSCEHESWEKSEAFCFLRSLKDKCIRSLPGFVDAPWGQPKTIEEKREEYMENKRQAMNN